MERLWNTVEFVVQVMLWQKFQIEINETVLTKEKEETNYVHTILHNIGSAKYLFFAKCFKKTTEYFLKFLFYLKVQSFRLIMENNFIQMAASAGHAVAYMIGPIFKHIIDCVQLYFTNGFTACRRNTCLWRHPTNNSTTVWNRSSEEAKQYPFCGW